MRFEKITIENFKNVEYGELAFDNKRRPDGPSILALYGQNGSGKSALVDCLLAFKILVMGESLPKRFAGYVNKNAGSARVVYEFTLCASRERYEIEFRDNGGVPELVNEVFSSEIFSDKNRMETLFTTKGFEQFGPKYLQRVSEGIGLPDRRDLFGKGASLLFSHGFGELTDMPEDDRSMQPLIDLAWFAGDVAALAEFDMTVVGTREAESIESGELIVAYDYCNYGVILADGHDREEIIWEEIDWEEIGNYSRKDRFPDDFHKLRISTDADRPSSIPFGLCASLSQGWLESINHLIGCLVPGMQLELRNADNGEAFSSSWKNLPVGSDQEEALIPVYVGSRRGDVSIPLSCESRGIQKLVSVAWLLARVYNESESVAVIDEIDSGIFEYLLGEVLRTVSEEGEGQLICTSHNLRPLEVIDKGYIAFTTSNPKNRFMRLRNVKATNNLRDFYYRSIYLGGQRESIFEPPSSGELSMAFMMAGSQGGEPDEGE